MGSHQGYRQESNALTANIGFSVERGESIAKEGNYSLEKWVAKLLKRVPPLFPNIGSLFQAGGWLTVQWGFRDLYRHWISYDVLFLWSWYDARGRECLISLFWAWSQYAIKITRCKLFYYLRTAPSFSFICEKRGKSRVNNFYNSLFFNFCFSFFCCFSCVLLACVFRALIRFGS